SLSCFGARILAMCRPLVTLLAILLGLAAHAGAQDLTLQEIILRAKPAVAVVVAEVGGQVTLRCGGVEKTVSPVPYRESGSGFFLSPRGWLVPTGPVVVLAQVPPLRWLDAAVVAEAFRSDRLPGLPTRRGPAPGQRQ